jgi:hypothetical protein
MKYLGAIGLLLAAGCASVEQAPAAPASETGTKGREFVDRLRVDTSWHPAPTGGECVTCWYELPSGAYIAQGWWWNSCGWGAWSPAFGCAPAPCHGLYSPARPCGFRAYRSR